MHPRSCEDDAQAELPAPEDIARIARAAVGSAGPGTPLAILAEAADLRDRTGASLSRVVRAGMESEPGDTRTRKLLRRAESARQELSAAEFGLAASWRTGTRQARPLRAVARLRTATEEGKARLLETPDGLIAAKEHDLARYADELRRTRFALTPSREQALDALLEAVVQGRPVLMLGPSGTGKTTLGRELARRLGVGLEIIPGNEVTAGQLWGTRGLDPVKGDVIRDGIVARAMIQGSLLLWDEANASEEAMEKFLKFKAYLTTRPGDLIRVPPESPELRPVHPAFGFLLTGNPKGEKHKTRAEFPPEIARELAEVPLGYLPEDELYDLCLASLTDADRTLPLAAEELRADGVLHSLVKFVAEVQNLYLGRSTARGAATDSSLRRLVIDPGMVTSWLQGWSFARARRGESLASFLDRQLLGLALSEKYPAEDRALLAQTANRFRFLATAGAKKALAVPGLNVATLTGTAFTAPLYTADREATTTLADAAAGHPYLQAQLEKQFQELLTRVAKRAGKEEEALTSALLGSSTAERIQELRGLAALDTATLKTRLGEPPSPPPKPGPKPGTKPRHSVEIKAGEVNLSDLEDHLRIAGLDTRIEGGLKAQVQKFVAAYAAGTFGFELDPRTLTFPQARFQDLQELRDALRIGAVNGVVVTAYPTRAEVDAMAAKIKVNVDALLDLPVTEFFVRHFEGRGGKIANREARVAAWRNLRWNADGQLALPSGHMTLPPQLRLRNVLGKRQLSFTNTARDVAVDTPLLQAAQAGTISHITVQGVGLDYERLVAAGASILAPDEWLALAALVVPGDTGTYLSPQTWDWLGGVTPSDAARGNSSSDGLRPGWGGADGSAEDSRARSVVRGTPGFADPDTAADVGLVEDEQPPAPAAALTLANSWSVEELKQWLVTEGLNDKLEGGTLEHWISRAEAAYRDGTLGFVTDPSKLRFPCDYATRARLKTGIEAGCINGAVVVAYPHDQQLWAIARRLAAKNRTNTQREHDALLDMPITVFLAEHFAGRGGTVYDKANRLNTWKMLRWPTGSETLPALFKQASQRRGVDPAAWVDRQNNRAAAYDQIHAEVYDNLSGQPLLKDVLGQTTLTFTDVRKDVPVTGNLLKDDGVLRTQRQGEGLSFIRLLRDDVSPTLPTEFLALSSVLADPATITSYPDVSSGERFAAITHSVAAGGNSLSGGLRLGWDEAELSNTDGRARSAVR